uniref:Retrovirus-related Pol polyprotein from transposon TNT 1-94 n=1 Tax=Tanacetum cinerariifolium TaxID=118510 RepID=A0A6L2M6Q0_TANCI|nr:retrovirus-related Pol polyprotein from transposon TNT 1-94 [Tanacetum cinerariifolium]
MHNEFEMSMMGVELRLGSSNQKMEDGIFFNQSKYIKEMLKKFGLKDSKPTKMPMSTEIKLTKDDEANSVDSSKYRGPNMLCARVPLEDDTPFHTQACKDSFQTTIGYLNLPTSLWMICGGEKVKQKKDGIFISQDKYVAEILRKFGLTGGKSASTPIDTEKPLLKDSDGEDVDVNTYRSMIGSLMYLTSSRPDIMFAFWNTVAIKQNNDVTRMQALVDKKKVVITEAAIREVL